MFIAHCSYIADSQVYMGSVHETLADAKKAAWEMANTMLCNDEDRVEEIANNCYVAHFYNAEQDYEDEVTVHVIEGDSFFGEM